MRSTFRSCASSEAKASRSAHPNSAAYFPRSISSVRSAVGAAGSQSERRGAAPVRAGRPAGRSAPAGALQPGASSPASRDRRSRGCGRTARPRHQDPGAQPLEDLVHERGGGVHAPDRPGHRGEQRVQRAQRGGIPLGAGEGEVQVREVELLERPRGGRLRRASCAAQCVTKRRAVHRHARASAPRPQRAGRRGASPARARLGTAARRGERLPEHVGVGEIGHAGGRLGAVEGTSPTAW